MKTSAAVAAATALTALTACSGSADPAGLDAGRRAELAARIAEARAVPPHREAALAAEYERATEEFVVTCMRESGHEYIVHLPATARTTLLPGNAVGGDPDEFARKYGYGISTFAAASPAEFEPPADPNDAVTAGLEPGARDAYRAALVTCRGRAATTVPRPATMVEVPLTDGTDVLADIDRRVHDHPAVVDATAAWSRCMAAAGVHHPDRESLRAELTRRTAALAGGSRTAAQEAELTELRRAEIAAAVADRACSPELDDATDLAYRDVLGRFVRDG